MVDLHGKPSSSGILQHSIDNTLFIVPGVVIVALVTFSVIKLYSSFRARQRAREEKRRAKEERKKKRL